MFPLQTEKIDFMMRNAIFSFLFAKINIQNIGNKKLFYDKYFRKKMWEIGLALFDHCETCRHIQQAIVAI